MSFNLGQMKNSWGSIFVAWGIVTVINLTLDNYLDFKKHKSKKIIT